MRSGYNNGLLEIDGRFVGVNLGADHVSEHEWGIKYIRQSFGMDDQAVGLERRIVRAVPVPRDYQPRLQPIFVRGVRQQVAAEGQFVGFFFDVRSEIPHELSYGFQDGLATAWSERAFGVRLNEPTEPSKRPGKRSKKTFGEKFLRDAANLKELYDAFSSLDVAIWLGGGGPFRNAGLCLAIASRLPGTLTAPWKEHDEEVIKLKADVEAIGIEEELRSAGKRWFALSPRRDGEKILFWLNPLEQDIHNYGWFSVEDLRLWAKDQGPVMGGRRARR